MRPNFDPRGWPFRCLIAGAATLLLTLLVPLSASAASLVPRSLQTTCLQAPANLDPASLSEAQLILYGLPLRPPASAGLPAQTRWLTVANRIKRDHHECAPQKAPEALAHHPSHRPGGQQGKVTPNVTQQLSQFWAGNFAVANAGTFSHGSANWNLPCTATSPRNALASFWVGIGGFGNGPLNEYTPQAGTDVHVDGSGNVSYTYWIEDVGPTDYINTFAMPNAHCGDTMYVEVDSPFSTDNVYYVIDGGGINRSFAPNWPVSGGDSGECLVERYHGVTPLANFHYVDFSNCDIDFSGIGNYPHNYYVLVNSSNQELAGPGAISNAGQNYRVTWFRAS